MNEPLVSVIIPAFNSESFITEAVESVMRQDYEHLEIIIVDDGSTDRTAEIVGRINAPIRLFRQSNKGPSAARNVGVQNALGDIIGFLDADDWWPDGKLRMQLSRMAEDPDLEIVLGRVKYTGDLNDIEQNLRFESDDQTVMNVNLGSGLFRREVFARVGLFAEDLRHFEDHDWFMRAREVGVRITILPETTLFYRRHDASTTRTDGIGKNMLPILKRSLDRRRREKEMKELPRFFDFDDPKSK